MGPRRWQGRPPHHEVCNLHPPEPPAKRRPMGGQSSCTVDQNAINLDIETAPQRIEANSERPLRRRWKLRRTRQHTLGPALEMHHSHRRFPHSLHDQPHPTRLGRSALERRPQLDDPFFGKEDPRLDGRRSGAEVGVPGKQRPPEIQVPCLRARGHPAGQARETPRLVGEDLHPVCRRRAGASVHTGSPRSFSHGDSGHNGKQQGDNAGSVHELSAATAAAPP